MTYKESELLKFETWITAELKLKMALSLIAELKESIRYQDKDLATLLNSDYQKLSKLHEYIKQTIHNIKDTSI